MNAPAASDPTAVANEPLRLYQAKSRVLSSAGTASAIATCSTARNGPTSLPLGLITPNVAASSCATKSRVDANTAAAAHIRIAPATSVRRRPIASARVVR